MKQELMESLPQVMQHYSDYNLLLPASTEVQLNPFYKYHVEEVPVDLSERSGDIFKVGSVSTGQKNERGYNIYEDVFALSKPLLNKMAMAAGIQFNPDKTFGERVDKMTYRATAQGAMRKADGSIRTETDQKVICLEDEEEKYRIEFADKAAKGITDDKQAKAAAELFPGEWRKAINRYGKEVNAFFVAESHRQQYVDRSVMVNMALLRKTWAEKAMTGAKLRVIRALLGLKGTYSKAELQKNFAITTVVFSPDYSDPEVRRLMLTQGVGSAGNMFGMQALPVKKVDFDDEVLVNDAEMTSAAFRSDSQDEDYVQDYTQPEPRYSEPEQAPEPEQDRSRTSDFCCDQCGCQISEKVWDFSVKKFGRPLCYQHQQTERR